MRVCRMGKLARSCQNCGMKEFVQVFEYSTHCNMYLAWMRKQGDRFLMTVASEITGLNDTHSDQG